MALIGRHQFVLADPPALWRTSMYQVGGLMPEQMYSTSVGRPAQHLGDLAPAMLHAVAEADVSTPPWSNRRQVFIAIGLA